jgi:hypothetical protein
MGIADRQQRTRQQHELAGAHAPPLPAHVETRAVVERDEEERRTGLPEDGRENLPAGGEPRDRDPVGRPPQRGRGMGLPRGRRGVGTQTERPEHVLPGRVALAVGVGLAGEPADAHAPI